MNDSFVQSCDHHCLVSRREAVNQDCHGSSRYQFEAARVQQPAACLLPCRPVLLPKLVSGSNSGRVCCTLLQSRCTRTGRGTAQSAAHRPPSTGMLSQLTAPCCAESPFPATSRRQA